MFVGPLLTYVLMDGLFVRDGPPRPPAPERIEELEEQVRSLSSEALAWYLASY